MANFEHKIHTDLVIKVEWKYPATSEDEKAYRNNIEEAYQEVSLKALIMMEDQNRIKEKEFSEKFQQLWDEVNP